MKKAALRKLLGVIRHGLDRLPIREQIEVYDALSVVMPTKGERGQAAYIAGILRQAEKQQLDFTRQLFRELQWPGHQHDVEKGNGGKS